MALIAGLGEMTILSAHDEAPPYLYYYSRMLGGIIIEQADGSDSRIIGEDVIPPGMTGLSGPGWSPSGHYFAAYNTTDGGPSGGTAYLIDVRGKAQFAGEYVSRTTYDMRWLGGEKDLLLIVGSIFGTYSPEVNTSFWVIDVQAGRALVEFGLTYNSLGDIVWDSESGRIIVYSFSQFYRPTQYYRTILEFDGTVIQESISKNKFLNRSPLRRLIINDDVYVGRAFSPSGRYRAYGQGNSYLRDRLTGREITLIRHSQASICRAYRWSADEQYIITLDGTLEAGGGCWQAVLGITDYQGQFWRELGGCSWSVPGCVGWLPQQVNVNHLPRGQSQPIQLDPIGFEAADFIGRLRDTNFRFRCGKDHTRYIVDIETNETLFELFDDLHCPPTENDRRVAEYTSITFAYEPVSQLLATAKGQESVSIWFMRDDVGKLIKQLNTYGYELEFTPDGSQLRARNRNAWKIYSVADILNTTDYNN